MPDYQNGKIYKLWSPQGNEIYIGSTINTLAKRFGHHKAVRKCTSKYLFENYTDVRIELIEAYPCNNKMELNRREGEHIRANDCLNKFIPCRTYQEYKKEWRKANKEKIKEKDKEYREANKEKIAQKQKEYYEANKEKIAENGKERSSQKIVCECGCEIIRGTMARHRRSNKHKKIMQMLSQPQMTPEEQKKIEYQKEYREANKEEILEKAKEKINCECGCEINRRQILRHRRTNKHKEIMQMLSQPQMTPEDLDQD